MGTHDPVAAQAFGFTDVQNMMDLSRSQAAIRQKVLEEDLIRSRYLFPNNVIYIDGDVGVDKG